MISSKYKMLALTALSVFQLHAYAQDNVLHLPIADVLKSDDAKEKLNGTVKFYFGSQSGGGTIVKANAVSNKKTNGFARSDEEACKRAMLSALISFQETANKLNATKVNNLVSYYKKDVFSSAKEYECHAGGFITGVALKGNIAR